MSETGETGETVNGARDPAAVRAAHERKVVKASLALGQGALSLAQAHGLTLGQLFEVQTTAVLHITRYLLLLQRPVHQTWTLADRLQLVRDAQGLAGALADRLRDLAGQLELGGDAFLQELQAEDQRMKDEIRRQQRDGTPRIIRPGGH